MRPSFLYSHLATEFQPVSDQLSFVNRIFHYHKCPFSRFFKLLTDYTAYRPFPSMDSGLPQPPSCAAP
jgi:hypothetical protein